MNYFSLKSCPIAPPPSAVAEVALPIPCPCPHCRLVTLAFVPPSCLPWLVVASLLIAMFLSRHCLLRCSLRFLLLPLFLPGWLSSHFSLHRLCLTLPLVAPPPLIDAPASCCVIASTLLQLSLHHCLLQHAGWLSCHH